MKQQIGILGAGRFAKEISLYATRLEYEVIHLFDGTNPDNKIIKDLPYCIGVGNPTVKKLILEQSGCRDFVSIYDPACIYGNDVVIGRGCVICMGVYLTINVILGDFVTLNINSTIGHDSRLGDLTNVAPGANVSGNVIIGRGCDIGTNAAIREKLILGNDVRLGLNCGVVKDILEPGIYIGTPARKIK
jgi:UDP-3-O-[3-hydroxymyristoyl] glucosamine N-acyltransferase